MDNAVENYFDNSLKLSTASGMSILVATVNLGADSYEIRLGGVTNLELYQKMELILGLTLIEGKLYLRTSSYDLATILEG